MNEIFVFNLKPHLNINTLKTFFNDLELDKNDIDLYKIAPFRSRKILFTKLIKNKLIINNKKMFSQNVSDVRSKKRKFSIFQPSRKQITILNKLISIIVNKAKKHNVFFTENLEVIFHFVKIQASNTGTSNSPEGIHRDGYDILVPCLVVERKNIRGGVSRFFINKKTIFSKIIKEGRCILVEENKNKDLYHDVTPIIPDNSNLEGYRSIIGIDINFI
jgi:hypothetical protein